MVNIEDDDEDIRKLMLNTVGIELGFDGLTFNLDNTVLQAQINQSYTGFVIDTQKMTIEIPNNPGISANVFGSGSLLSEVQLQIDIKVKNEDFGAAFSCTGIVSR